MREIREWLEKGQAYAQGVALYETYGKSRVVLRSLQYGETEFTRATLRRELTKLAGGEPVRGAPMSGERVHETPKSVHVAPQKVASSPEKVASSSEKVASSPEHPERRTWYATRAYAHALLETAATDGERRELATQILALTKQISASFRADPGEPADVAAPVDLASVSDAGELRRLLANLRSLRTKLKHRPDRAGDLVRAQIQITQLETKLKNRDGEKS